MFALDGVVIDPNTIPGGNKEQFNLGVTAVHEVGHWIGLFHTFEAGDGSDGCQGQGDLIDDTPAEQSAATGCAFVRYCLSFSLFFSFFLRFLKNTGFHLSYKRDKGN